MQGWVLAYAIDFENAGWRIGHLKKVRKVPRSSCNRVPTSRKAFVKLFSCIFGTCSSGTCQAGALRQDGDVRPARSGSLEARGTSEAPRQTAKRAHKNCRPITNHDHQPSQA